MILYSKETAAVIVRDSTRSISFKKIFINILNTCCVHVCVFYVRVSHIFVSKNNSVKRNVHITKWYIYNNNIPNYSLFVFFFFGPTYSAVSRCRRYFGSRAPAEMFTGQGKVYIIHIYGILYCNNFIYSVYNLLQT